MTQTVIKPVTISFHEAGMRLHALLVSAPKYNCRIRKCRRNRRCSGEMVASDGRLEALALAEYGTAPWPSGARIPPCLRNTDEHTLPAILRELPAAYGAIAECQDSEASIRYFWKIARRRCMKKHLRVWSKKPA